MLIKNFPAKKKLTNIKPDTDNVVRLSENARTPGVESLFLFARLHAKQNDFAGIAARYDVIVVGRERDRPQFNGADGERFDSLSGGPVPQH